MAKKCCVNVQKVMPKRGYRREISLKVLTNEKRGELKVGAFDSSPFKIFSLRFQTDQCRPHPVKGIKLLRETCFYYLKSMIVSQCRYSFGGLEKIRETCMPLGEFKHRYWFFADAPNINYSIF